MKSLFSRFLKALSGNCKSTDKSQDRIEKETSIEEEDRQYELSKIAYKALPDGYEVRDKKIYWKNLELRMLGTIRSTFFYNETLLVICDSKCSGSNIYGFDLHGTQIWTIDPIPYPSTCPEYEFVEVQNGKVYVLHGPNMFELDMRTGKIGERLSSHWR